MPTIIDKETRTAIDIIESEIAYRREHGMNIPKYATGHGEYDPNEETCVGAWSESKQRYCQIAGKCIGNLGWVSLNYEILVNGELPIIHWTPYQK